MPSAASRPSRTPQTTSEAPRTMSPPANTPGMRVIMVCQSIRTVPQRVTCSSGSPNSAGRSSGSKPSALITRSASSTKLRIRRPAPASARPGRIGRAQTHAHGAHGASTVRVAEERLGRRQPDELHAFLLGVAHLAHRARHVGAVAPVEALHRLGALADRGAHAVHRGVAAADHDHALAGGVERAGVEGRHGVAQALAVAGGQIVERRHDVAAGRSRAR